MRAPHFTAVASLIIGGMAVGCASKGTKPEDMTSAQHLAASEGEERAAAEHEAQYDPGAAEFVERCGTGKVCWSSTVNPTAAHNADAEEHRALAAKHRQASQALVQAEQSACVGISDEDRDLSPFAHRADIVSVTAFNRDETHGKLQQEHLAGATVVFRAVPGMTQQWLQRVVDCHAARNAVVGDTMPKCPLAVKGATAAVRALPDGFAVDVQSKDGATAKVILERAQKLL